MIASNLFVLLELGNIVQHRLHLLIREILYINKTPTRDPCSEVLAAPYA